jgi:beta-lactamase class A
MNRRAALTLLLFLPPLFSLAPDATAARPQSPDVLRKSIEQLIAKTEAGELAVAFIDPTTSTEIFINADSVIHAASTMKVPVMMEVYRQAQAGLLSPDDRMTVRNDFPSIADGSAFALDPADDSELTLYKRLGDAVSVRELVRLMITESSNLATNLLVERVSARRVSAFMNDLGAPSLRVLRGVEDNAAYQRGMNNTVTARGLAHILRLLLDGKVVSHESSRAMLEVLKAQKFREGIPARLPPGTAVAHKTGWIKGRYYHDAAVIYPSGRKPYVLVVLTRGIKDDAQANRLVADIAGATYDYASGK